MEAEKKEKDIINFFNTTNFVKKFRLIYKEKTHHENLELDRILIKSGKSIIGKRYSYFFENTQKNRLIKYSINYNTKLISFFIINLNINIHNDPSKNEFIEIKNYLLFKDKSQEYQDLKELEQEKNQDLLEKFKKMIKIIEPLFLNELYDVVQGDEWIKVPSWLEHDPT